MATVVNNVLNTKVVPHAQWVEARKKLLAKEKEFTRLRDELSRSRRALPCERVDKEYVFEGPRGKEKLADLFRGRSQLIVYHFMFGPGWKEGCPSCSFLADTFDGAAVHMAQRDVTFVAISRATLPEIQAFQKRMGWRFKWLSSFGSDFNFDFNVSFTPEQIAAGRAIYNYREGASPMEEMSGRSIFYKNESGEIFHTYSSFARGGEVMLGTYALLDMMPNGRNEKNNLTDWVKLHDRYEAAAEEAGDCH